MSIWSRVKPQCYIDLFKANTFYVRDRGGVWPKYPRNNEGKR